jgi:RNA polymerase sigma factor for flagellar operon FliA
VSRLAAYAEHGSSGADALVREYLPLVKKIALRLAVKLPPDIEVDDLMQVGLIGLLRARESYDAAQGASFGTYAGIRIKGAMLDELRSHDWLPRSVQEQFTRVAEAIDRVSAQLGRPAQDGEIAAALNLSLEEYQELAGRLACARMTHIDDHPEVEHAAAAADPAELAGDAAFRQSWRRRWRCCRSVSG